MNYYYSLCDSKQEVNNELLLFTTKTCPNCKMAKMILDKAGIKYVAIDAEENKELTINYGVTKAPTLFVPGADGATKLDNVSLIKKFVEDRHE